jgi:thioredoxin reductase/NAD-dependent dihydropyrimidine dehydrogenase PreA subunit
MLAESMEQKLTEPASLHPVFNPQLCIGCGACYRACPEGNVIGIIEGKARLVTPSNCIGHGACRVACPMDAIDLVFGTATRGVDIPHLHDTFETDVPGLYIAGELGGMGLIRNAILQGQEAVEDMARKGSRGTTGLFDVLIAGAGPAGISAALKAKELGLNYILVEQESLGGTVSHYPKGKCVMTTPAKLPIYGKLPFRETTKEELMAFWRDVARDQELNIHYDNCVNAIETDESSFITNTSKQKIKSRHVLLALGRRGTPRKLDVPGEEDGKVVYTLVDPEQYAGKQILVVGGGDSALESAIALAARDDTSVTLSYRGDGFHRAKPANRKKIADLEAAGMVDIVLGSEVEGIEPHRVILRAAEKTLSIDNDSVIVNVGGVLPTKLLKDCGITVETKYGTR